MTSDTSVDRLLARRAAALARPVEEISDSGDIQVVIVSVAGGRRYAIEARYVRQVVRNEQLRRLPVSGSELLGLVPAKGEAVPVVDLASLLGVSGADRTVRRGPRW